MYLWRDSYKEFTYIYGGIHVRSSHISMEGLTFRKGFIQGVHIYLWQDSHVGRDSYKAFICIYDRTHM